MKINFDKRIELIFGLIYCVDKEYHLFAENSYCKETQKEYCQEFYRLYKTYASPELKEYIKNGGLGFYDITATLALSLNNKYELQENEEAHNIINEIPTFNGKKLEKLLKDFVKNSNYEEFYLKHQNFYHKLLEKYKKALNTYVNFNENLIINFYGYKIKEMKIILYNFVNGNFGINYENNIINLTSAILNNDGEFSPRIINICFHEFSHPYINPLGYKYFKDKDITYLLNNAIANNLEKCYFNEIILINEYIVRSIQVYLSKQYMEEEYITRQIIYHQNRGYVYIEEVIKLFDKKNNYETFEEFYENKIVNYFINLNIQLKATPKL